jgi:hypothetical protein
MNLNVIRGGQLAQVAATGIAPLGICRYFVQASPVSREYSLALAVSLTICLL